MQSRKEAVRQNFVSTFAQSLKFLYQICEEESSFYVRLQRQAEIAIFAGLSYWALRDIAAAQTPYGNFSFNPLPCILIGAGLSAQHAYENGKRASRVANFFGTKNECEIFSQDVAQELYQRFEFIIQLLVNNDYGVRRLAHFFVDAIAHGLEHGASRNIHFSKHKQLVELSLPDNGNNIYFRYCLQKKVKLHKRAYLVPSSDNYLIRHRSYFSIMDIINKSPAFLENSIEKKLCIREGTGGEKIYPPQRLNSHDARFVTQSVHFNEDRYIILVSIFNDPNINYSVKLSQLKNIHDVMTEQEMHEGVDCLISESKKQTFKNQYRKQHPVSSFFYLPNTVSDRLTTELELTI